MSPNRSAASWMPGVVVTSAIVVVARGVTSFIKESIDPLGGINSLWPLFGISNQLLSAIAFCVATTIIMKAHRRPYAWITVVPLVWLVTVTFSAGWQKSSRPIPNSASSRMRTLLPRARSPPLKRRNPDFNDHLDAAVCGVFLILVTVIIVDSVRVWYGILTRNPSFRRVWRSSTHEAIVRYPTSRLARELSDESAYARHLQLTGHVHSAAEWRAFIDHKHKRKYQNAKCC